MELTVVGSGTAAPDPERVGSGYWLDAADTRVLLDCGPGTVQRMAALALPWERLDHLFLSHFHTDHIAGLPVLLFALKWGLRAPRTAPLNLWAPHGIRSRLTAMRAAFGDHVEDPGCPLVIREIDPDDELAVGPLRVRATRTPHTAESLAFRIAGPAAAGTAVLGYTGDTGPDRSLGDFFEGCDLLVAECSLPDDEAVDTHLSPSSLAALARRARPRRLLVTHVYPQLERLDPLERLRRAGWSGDTLRATDGLRLQLDGHG